MPRAVSGPRAHVDGLRIDARQIQADDERALTLPGVDGRREPVEVAEGFRTDESRRPAILDKRALKFYSD
jgi:hypothetical protein